VTAPMDNAGESFSVPKAEGVYLYGGEHINFHNRKECEYNSRSQAQKTFE